MRVLELREQRLALLLVAARCVHTVVAQKEAVNSKRRHSLCRRHGPPHACTSHIGHLWYFWSVYMCIYVYVVI